MPDNRATSSNCTQYADAHHKDHGQDHGAGAPDGGALQANHALLIEVPIAFHHVAVSSWGQDCKEGMVLLRAVRAVNGQLLMDLS